MAPPSITARFALVLTPRSSISSSRQFARDLDILKHWPGQDQVHNEIVGTPSGLAAGEPAAANQPPVEPPVHFTEIRKRVGWRPGQNRRRPAGLALNDQPNSSSSPPAPAR